MTDSQRDALGGWAASLLGVAAFFVFAGWWVLIPTNIAWLGHGDQAMHTLGWMFYRDAPWGLPPGDSPRLGIELANSIALVDGLPLFALPLKLLSPLLPTPFQYWGYWWLACFALQALFGYRLARELGASRLVALVAAGFVVITPAFLFRLWLHMALAGHWTILAALWLYARREPSRASMWPLLIGLTAAIHAYLFAMVCAVWAASWLSRLWTGQLRGLAVVLEPLWIVVVSGIVLWSVGFFYTGTLGGIGYGFFRLNLFGPFISQGWSRLVPSLPHSDYDYEGLSFLGVGIFAALILCIVTGSIVQVRTLFTRRWLPLTIVGLLLCLFALSNVIGLFDREAGPIPLPDFWLTLGSMFRSTGRFVWPVLYLATVGAVVLASRRLNPALAAALLAVFFAVQAIDSSWSWSAFRRTIPEPATTWPTELTSPAWARAAAAGYSRLRAIPVRFKDQDWKELETLASRLDMDTDAVYLGRVDTDAVARLAAHEVSALDSGDLEPHTLYVLSQAAAQRLTPHLAPGDLLADIDGRLVFAKGGSSIVDGLGIDPHSGVGASAWLPAGLAQFTGL